MPIPSIVLDTNVLVAAIRSKRGASFHLIELIGTGRFEINLSVPLALEYEAIGKREAERVGLKESSFESILQYLYHVAIFREIFFLWRPLLPDPGDDMVLEVAVAAGNAHVITFNERDFRGAESFGIRTFTPKDFLVEIGAVR